MDRRKDKIKETGNEEMKREKTRNETSISIFSFAQNSLP